MKQFLISPPFGNIISHPKCTSVVGTFTLNPRGSNWTKLYRLIKTTRPVESGWVNNVGLQNPGIYSVRNYQLDKLYSIAALDSNEWDGLYDAIPETASLEINLSCPNVGDHPEIIDEQVKKFLQKYKLVIFKLSPTSQAENVTQRLISLGAQYFHLFNTISMERGGESGDRLKEFGLQTIKKVRVQYPDIKIIAGGGIYSVEDIESYKNVGANYFSLASVFLNPIQVRQLLKNL